MLLVYYLRHILYPLLKVFVKPNVYLIIFLLKWLQLCELDNLAIVF